MTWRNAPRIVLLLLPLALAAPAPARGAPSEGGSGAAIPPASSLVKVVAAPVNIAPGGEAVANLRLTVAPGWHINANPPSPDYMIATEVTAAAAGGVSAGAARYPAAKHLKVSFDASEIAAWNGDVELTLPLTAAAGAAPGPVRLAGTVHFQGCNDQVCLAPATVHFELPVTIAAATPSDRPAESARPPAGGAAPPAPTARGTGFTSGPPTAGAPPADARGGLEGALALGGVRWLLVLFVGGLLLNLTPCVFPMLGITVSIFGARRDQPLPKVVTHATVYVLGIVLTYSVLGVVAALTGSLFGAALQSPWVSVGLGVLLIGLSLSMFGLYELQPPAALMQALGGANVTSLLGIFVSGLGVGIVAAPCIGPFVVGVLALIAARQDVGFGLRTMFTLALGLGAPYLVLATFSNLLPRLPRSGEWMVWVKKVFGVILLAVGLFYMLLALAPRLAPWVLPAVLVLGGAGLGFAGGPGGRPAFRWFQRLAGAAAIAAGVAIVATTPTRGIAFAPLSPAALEAARSAGRVVMIDFSADWCVPCHELERATFTDRRVISAAGGFTALKVDLTRYDSPEVMALRARYGIAGVPTVLFLAPDGREVREARVEGFLPPERFLERIGLVGARPAGG